jgi:hypothetical protein
MAKSVLIEERDKQINELQKKVLELMTRQPVNISYSETNNNAELEANVKRLRGQRSQFYQENEKLKRQLAEKEQTIIALQKENKEVWELFEVIKNDSIVVKGLIINTKFRENAIKEKAKEIIKQIEIAKN